MFRRNFAYNILSTRMLQQRSFHINSILFSKRPSSFPDTVSPLKVNPPRKRRLDVAIVGLPNAGKSQLLNVLTQSTVSAVSRKRHTTRQGILGARTVIDGEHNTQLLFVDTPGFLKVDQAKREGLERDLTVTASTEMQAVDYSLVVVDAAKSLTDDVKLSIAELMWQALQSEGRFDDSDDDDDDDDDFENENESEFESSDSDTSEDESKQEPSLEKFAIVLNKVDLVRPKSDLISIALELGDLADECIQYRGQPLSEDEVIRMDEEELEKRRPSIFYTSALSEEGVDDVLKHLLNKATPCRSWELEAGEATSLTPEERIEEVIREKIYRCLHKEIPYTIRQKNTLLQVARDRQTGKQGVLIHQELTVRTNSHREIVRGSGGMTLERIRETAERDLSKIFDCKVVLQLFIKTLKGRKRKWSI